MVENREKEAGENQETTQMGLHSIKNILGDQRQVSMFSDHDQEFSKEYGVELQGTIDRFGIDLTNTQYQVMEGILWKFSKTGYKGTMSPVEVESIVKNKHLGKSPEIYTNITQLPKIRATQADILKWSGVNRESAACHARAVEAIRDLGSQQYCFYYDRLSYDENGVPKRDNKGLWKKEGVVAVDTLFTIKEVRGDTSGVLQYYEITPSAIFLDQRESYFMRIPLGWRQEVQTLVGKKKASSYTFRFLLFLRYQYELKRRVNLDTAQCQIKWAPEEIAIAIKMPESVYKRKKKRMNDILEDAYIVAKKLGYLFGYEREGHLDTLILNNKKYSNLNRLKLDHAIDKIGEKIETQNKAAINIFTFFYKQRQSLDETVMSPEGNARKQQIDTLGQLLKKRSIEDVEKLILWSMKKSYWCSRLSTPNKLLVTFSEAWSAMMVDEKGEKGQLLDQHKKFTQMIVKNITSENNEFKIESLNQHVEIIAGAQSWVFDYSDKQFKEKFLNRLNIMGINAQPATENIEI